MGAHGRGVDAAGAAAAKRAATAFAPPCMGARGRQSELESSSGAATVEQAVTADALPFTRALL